LGRKPIGAKPTQTRDRKKGLSLEGLSDIEEAADQLGVSTKTIRRYISGGRIEAHKVRNIWFIPAEEIDRLQKARDEEQANVSPMFDEIAGLIRGISSRLDRLEDRVATPAKPAAGESAAEAASLRAELEATERKVSQLEDENRILRDELVEVKEELNRKQIEIPAPQMDPQAIKNRAEEIDSLKALIVSNERGLSLLREEVKEKDAVIAEKEQEILQLLEKLKDMENLRKQPVAQEQKKQGLFGSIMKGVSPTSGRS